MKQLIPFLILIFALTSCKKDCSVGYSGKDCKTEVVKSFFGQYNGSLTVNTQAGTYAFEVGTLSDDATEFKVGTFTCTLSNNNGQFYIPTQTVSANGLAYTAYGNGSFINKNLVMQYTLERNGTYTSFYFTGHKAE